LQNSSINSVFDTENSLEIKIFQSFALDPTGGADDAPPDPIVGWGRGYTLAISPLPSRFHGWNFRSMELSFREAKMTWNFSYRKLCTLRSQVGKSVIGNLKMKLVTVLQP